jgi:hypothetical protein
MHNSALLAGMTVVCTDNENIETLVKKNETYTVQAVAQRGQLVRIPGVPFMLASSRFQPVAQTPTNPIGLSNASNQ